MLWAIDQRKLWGDYGRSLISASATRAGPGKPLELHRTGPFLPPIFFPYGPALALTIVVSEDFRRELEQSPFSGLRFDPVIKSRIVKLDWHKWDLKADRPKMYPPGGVPENYYWNEPHDPRTAAQMPVAWELLLPVVPLRMEQLEDPRGGYLDRFGAYLDREDYPSLFQSHPKYGHMRVDNVAREWLANRVDEWIRFCELEITRA